MPLCCPGLLRACGHQSGEAEHLSGLSSTVSASSRNCCSRSSRNPVSRLFRNAVRNYSGIAFTVPADSPTRSASSVIPALECRPAIGNQRSRTSASWFIGLYATHSLPREAARPPFGVFGSRPATLYFRLFPSPVRSQTDASMERQT